jgi:hypothetical protein
LGLVKNGVPFERAEALEMTDMLAWTIIFGEFDGGEFDFRHMQWQKRS